MELYQPFARPLYVMLKPVGSSCNLDCQYCYYSEKSQMYHGHKMMSEETLEQFIRQYLEAQTSQQVLFTWHGGEPLLRDVSFYKKALELQRRYGHHHIIDNCIQTNGTLLTDEWCEFFKENNWLVGISIDGIQPWHDQYRPDHQGNGSWDKVMHGISLLKKHDVEWNAMAVVNHENADHPKAFYQFFKALGCQFLQFSPIVERLTSHADGRHLASPCETGNLAHLSVTAEQWGRFLIGVFEEWIKADVGEIFVQIFDSTLACWMGETPGVCSMARTCGHAGVMESDGDVYCCDHYVFPEYKLGNIRTKSLYEMMNSERQLAFGRAKDAKLPQQCLDCTWNFSCNGGCPKDRFIATNTGEPGLNYLCEGYRAFFSHVAPAMDFMKHALERHTSPATVMPFWRERAKHVL